MQKERRAESASSEVTRGYDRPVPALRAPPGVGRGRSGAGCAPRRRGHPAEPGVPQGEDRRPRSPVCLTAMSVCRRDDVIAQRRPSARLFRRLRTCSPGIGHPLDAEQVPSSSLARRGEHQVAPARAAAAAEVGVGRGRLVRPMPIAARLIACGRCLRSGSTARRAPGARARAGAGAGAGARGTKRYDRAPPDRAPGVDSRRGS